MRCSSISAPFTVAALLALVGACRSTPPPFGSVSIDVDTDVDVPRLVSNLRLDVYSNGVWIDSRQIPLRDARLLPSSFAVFSSSAAASSDALIRLRAYGDGALVDAPTDARLVVNGVDVTPAQEPDPALAIDQLFHFTLDYGQTQRAHVVLSGACAGIPADVTTGITCTSTDAAPTNGATSLAGTFGTESRALPTPRAPSGDDDGGEALVPGGAFVLGSRDLSANTAWSGIDVSAAPPRLVVVSSFLMDRFEVTVGRFRRALAMGFVPSLNPTADDAPFPATLSTADATDSFCSFSNAPRPASDASGSREAMPLNCVSFDTARAFCMFIGGDLPTEAEWEYAATAAARPAKTPYSYGGDAETCAGTVFARTTIADPETSECARAGAPCGPQRVGLAGQDVTPAASDGSAIHDLTGNVGEWTSDVYRTFDDPCWQSAPQRDPSCAATPSDRRVVRGGAFTDPRGSTVAALRKPSSPELPFSGIGFRCVRRGAGP